MAEGAGCMIVESLEHAKKRGAKIYAELVGGAMNADAYHITAPNPTGESIIDVMQDALEDANLLTTEIDYINVHGTSTPLGDVAMSSSVTSFLENIHITKHAEVRMNKRGITRQMLELVLMFGRKIYARGVVFYVIGKKIK